MRRVDLGSQLPVGAAPGKKLGLRVCWTILLGAAALSLGAWGAPAPGDKPAAAPAKEAAAADFVGQEVCASCHEKEAGNFTSNPHSRLAGIHGKTASFGKGAMSAESWATCESCHGPGRAHVEGGGDVTKIFTPAKASTKEIDATCLKCHAGAHPDFERSPHAKADVGCTGCHSIHKGESEDHLLKASQPTLCFQCHTDEKPQFDMPSHHKVNEGLVRCSDCHDVHGTFEKSNLRSRNDSNLICTKCHTEKRGPFVYEHTPVKGEGCMGCHTPHGSQNARMLNMPNINLLCNQCHSPVSAATVHGVNAGSSELTPCTDCHTFIHGSNLNVAFLR
jgi:DmsE family decaheme c-type cytochrome